MKPIIINKIALGEGLPKICIPIVAVSEEAILAEAEKIAAYPHSIVEWRADFFENLGDSAAIRRVMCGIRRRLPDTLLLFTFRTHNEGGNMVLSMEDYLKLCAEVISYGMADLVDLELFTGFPEGALLSPEELAGGALKASPLLPLLEAAHEHGIYVVLSNHDFQKTPDKEVLMARFSAMEAIGGDIAKIAVMPQTREDVLTLLSASKASDEALDCPIISMSMGRLGVVSRLAGALSGSAVTFGTAGSASAPGQIGAKELQDILEIIG